MFIENIDFINEIGFAGESPVPPIPREERFLAISTRLHLPIAPQTASTGRQVLYSSTHIGFPAVAGVTEWYSAWPHFYGNEDPVNNPQATVPEVDIPNAASVYATLGIAGVFTDGSFDGQFEGVMEPGTWGRWCFHGNPTYTPSGTGKFKSAHVCALNAIRPVGFSRQSVNNEAAEWGSSLNLAKIRTGGTITHNAAISYFYGPCLLIGKGMDNRMVMMIFGNSIDFSSDETPSLADTRGNMGFWQRGLDDAADRRPYINFAIPGSRFGQQLSILPGAFRRRSELLKSVPTGVPFDVAGAGDENSALNDSVAWRQLHDDMADFINDNFGMPFVHRSMFPKASSVGNGRTALSDQTAAVDQRVAVGNDLVANPADYPTFQIGEAYRDAGVPTKWAVNPFTATVVGTYAGSGAIVLTARPENGTALVFGDGTANVAIRIVTSTTANGANWNCFCSTVPPVNAGTADGATVKATQTDGDWTHPTTAENVARGTPVVISGKANLVF